MHGVGTKTDITTNRDHPVVLDITRLASRVGRGPLTGVDRVELAYLNWCLQDVSVPFYCLARISGGYALLDREGALVFRSKLLGALPWGRPDLRARVSMKLAKARRAAESDLRRLSIERSGRQGPPEIPLPKGVYLNTGHSNLSKATLAGMRDSGLKVATLIHDMIPLDWPQFQRDGTVQSFEDKMRRAADYSDLVIANSGHTQTRVKHYFDGWGAQVEYVTAFLGADPMRAEVSKSASVRPYFVALGTIEPRKNHAFLLDIWEQLEVEHPATQLPELHIVGRRGWKNEDVFKRLDQLKGNGWLFEHNNMQDAEVRRLLSGSHGLLFPSLAEGFGLPSIEAAQLGVPVICGDLAIHREVLGDYPVYADLQDIYLWKKTILEQAEQRQKDLVHAHIAKSPKIPTWSEHFDAVNEAMGNLL